MRLVLDTNVVSSGLLWNGPPRSLLDAAIGGAVEIYTSTALAAELREALGYAKFAKRLAENGSTIDLAVERFMAIANLVASATIERVLSDPDDDQVLACALAAGADLIVSGDTDPLNLKSFHRIPILSATSTSTASPSSAPPMPSTESSSRPATESAAKATTPARRRAWGRTSLLQQLRRPRNFIFQSLFVPGPFDYGQRKPWLSLQGFHRGNDLGLGPMTAARIDPPGLTIDVH